jgi:ribonuclease Z
MDKLADIDPVKLKSIFWQKKMVIPGTRWEICGYSRSAYRTGFYIPSLNIMLDAGPQAFHRPDHIFITHTHIDHIAGLPLTMIGDQNGNHIFHVYAPTSAEKWIYNYISAMFSANCMMTVDPSEWYVYHGLSKESLNVTANNTRLKVELFECDHKIPTISYGFTELKNKLKKEYLGLPEKEIKSMKKAGTPITEDISVKRFAYVCDTSIKVFCMNPTILEYPVIFIECTFILDNELENANKTQHIHWSQLKPYVKDHPSITFILFHFSQRYHETEIDDFFKKEETLKNIKWF